MVVWVWCAPCPGVSRGGIILIIQRSLTWDLVTDWCHLWPRLEIVGSYLDNYHPPRNLEILMSAARYVPSLTWLLSGLHTSYWAELADIWWIKWPWMSQILISSISSNDYVFFRKSTALISWFSTYPPQMSSSNKRNPLRLRTFCETVYI